MDIGEFVLVYLGRVYRRGCLLFAGVVFKFRKDSEGIFVFFCRVDSRFGEVVICFWREV